MSAFLLPSQARICELDFVLSPSCGRTVFLDALLFIIENYLLFLTSLSIVLGQS